jgi:hypothetical protein
MAFYHQHAPKHREHERPLPDYSELQGMKALQEEAALPSAQWKEEVRRGKEFGLECVDSIKQIQESLPSAANSPTGPASTRS